MNLCQLLFALVLSFAFAQSQNEPQATIVQNSFVQDPDGSYKWHYKLSDGQFRDEIGSFKTNSDDEKYFEIRGRFGFKGSDGKDYSTEYIAGDKGFMAAGKHLPENLPGTVRVEDWPSLSEELDNLSIDGNLLKSLVG